MCGAELVSARERRRNIGYGRAFTLIEMIMVLGTILVLIGLLLPALGASWQRAELTRDSAQLRQNVTLVQLYSRNAKDMYPLGRPDPFQSAGAWHEPVVAAGLASSPTEFDPTGVKKLGLVRFHMSVCMVYSADRMRQGFTVPPNQAVSQGIGEHQVVYPSAKGMMLRKFDRSPFIEQGGLLFCCGQRWETPVAMADGSVETGDYVRYSGGEPVVQIDGIGVPIWSTWGGYRGRDK